MKLAARIVSALLVSVMLTLNITAAGPTIYYGELKNYYGECSTDLSRDAYNAIKTAASEFRDSVSLSAYNIPTNQISDLYMAVVRDNPSLFYLANSYGYMPSGGKVSSLMLKYAMPKDQLASAVAEYNSMAAAITDSVPNGLDDIGKVLYVHDYMASHFEYDLTYSIYDSYSMLKYGKGVCQAYTALFIELMDRLGVDSSWAVSDMGNHTWNVVKLDGNWYHVDVTHDDPINDCFGMAQHSHFLWSDSKMLNKFPDMECAFSCTDSSYESSEWMSTGTPLAYVDGKWYGAYSEGLYEVDIKNDVKTQVLEEANIWNAWDMPGYFYTDIFSGLAVVDGVLYYNSAEEIRSYNPATGESAAVYKPDTSNGYIYGLIYSGDRTFTYKIATEPGGDGELRTFTVAPKVVTGDINGDGKISTTDVMMLKRALAGFITLSDSQNLAADVNCDRRTTITDVMILKRALVGLITLSNN